MNLHEKARELNADLATRRPDLEWHVANGSLVLGHSKAWSEWHRDDCARRMDEERRRFNWRLQHPVAEEGDGS